MHVASHHAAGAVERRLFGAIVRRFCGCDFVRACSCGLPRPASGWTVESLTSVRDLMRQHGSLATVAEIMGESRQRVNIALDALLGRTPAHALAALEAKAARK